MEPNRWAVFAVLFASRTAIAYQFQSLASIGPLLTGGLGMDFATFGALIGCYMLPGILVALPGGLLDQRLGGRRTIMLGLGLMTAGGLLLLPGSTSFLFAGRLVSGAGAAILNVVLTRAISTRFDDGELTAAMAIFVASWPLGIALALVSVPVLTVAFGWATLGVVSVVPSLLCLLLFAATYREAGEQRGSGGGLRLNLSSREMLLAVLAGLVWGLYNVAYVVFTAAMPDLFFARGYNLTEAAALASVFGWVLIVSVPLGGLLGQRLGHETRVITACLLIIIASALALAATPATYLSFAILVAAIGLPAGLIVAIPAQILPTAIRPGGMGIFFTVFYLAMATLPGVAGLVREATGNPASPFVFGAAALVAAILVLLCLASLTRRVASPGLDPQTS
jgi:MFS family permease